VKPCLESIQENLSRKYEVEIIVGDTGSRKKEVFKFYSQAGKKWENVRFIKIGKYFFSKNYNNLVKKYAQGEYLIFLNNDTIAGGNWIDALIDPLLDKRIGVVGAKLLYADGSIQHAGMEFSKDFALAVHRKEKKDISEVNFKAYVPVVTFACAAVRHDVFERFRLSEEFREECQDADFCLRLREAGFKVLYNPEAEIYHLECSTRNWRKGERDRTSLRKNGEKKWTKFHHKRTSGRNLIRTNTKTR